MIWNRLYGFSNAKEIELAENVIGGRIDPMFVKKRGSQKSLDCDLRTFAYGFGNPYLVHNTPLTGPEVWGLLFQPFPRSDWLSEIDPAYIHFSRFFLYGRSTSSVKCRGTFLILCKHFFFRRILQQPCGFFGTLGLEFSLVRISF